MNTKIKRCSTILLSFIVVMFSQSVIGIELGTPSASEITIEDESIELGTPLESEIVIEDDSCQIPTSHGSCLANGLDSALVGNWKLILQTINTPNGPINMPFSGRVTTFNDDIKVLNTGEIEDATFTEDYSTDSVDDVTANFPGGSITSRCSVSGTSSGTYFISGMGEPDSNTGAIQAQLKITSRQGKPQVVCNGGGSDIKSNTASIPLGVGRSRTYLYTIQANKLTIKSSYQGAGTITHVFQKI